MPIVIIDNYDSFTFNLYQMVQELSPKKVEVYRNDQITASELQQRKPDGIILSPGPGHPANHSDFGVCATVITDAENFSMPVLGVCLGHQGIVHYLGGQVIQAPEIVHGKTSKITKVKASRLLSGLPKQFSAMRYHSLVAQEENFPAELEICARESSLGLIMAVQHRKRRLFGVQFHPESIGTPEGKTILENFVKLC
jgi:anthranilate synthase component II